jgi:membrane fusion protein (multidrug efflux system)
MDQSSPTITASRGAPAEPLAPPPRRSRRPFVILAIILLAIALGCFGYWLLNHGYATTDDAQIDGDIYTISPRIAGQIAAVTVDDNQHVSAGDTLASLDPRDQEVALAQARAQAAQADANLAVATANAGQAQANVVQANAAEAQAQQDFDRYNAINPHAITRQTLDAATAAIRSAKAKDEAAIQAAAASQAAITAAQAQVRGAAVAVQNAQLQLSYANITAPASGHVSMKTVQPGNVVAPGSSLMALVGDDVWVTANYKETQLAGIHPGSPATITVDAVPGVTFKGHVQSIQYGTGAVFSLLPAQNATGNYIKIVQRVPVKIVFDDPRVRNYLLAPGMSVQPSVIIGK